VRINRSYTVRPVCDFTTDDLTFFMPKQRNDRRYGYFLGLCPKLVCGLDREISFETLHGPLVKSDKTLAWRI
jgi:hypothetical protein